MREGSWVGMLPTDGVCQEVAPKCRCCTGQPACQHSQPQAHANCLGPGRAHGSPNTTAQASAALQPLHCASTLTLGRSSRIAFPRELRSLSSSSCTVCTVKIDFIICKLRDVFRDLQAVMCTQPVHPPTVHPLAAKLKNWTYVDGGPLSPLLPSPSAISATAK